MGKDAQFGSWSLGAAGATMLAAQAFQPIMLAPLEVGLTAGWLVMLIASVVALIIYVPVMAGIASLPDGNLISLARAAAGTPGAIITGLLVSGLLLLHSGLILRQTAEMTVSAAYPLTPQTFAVVALVLCTLYGALGGTAAIVRLCRGFLAAQIVTISLVLVGTFGWGELRYILPFWGPGPGRVLTHSPILAAMYLPALFLPIAAGPVRNRQRAWHAALITLGVATLLYIAIKVVLLMSYPYPLGPAVTFPLHEMSRLVLGGRFFERIEGLWILAWVTGAACLLSGMVHAAAVCYRDAFRKPTHVSAVWPMVSMVLTISMVPPDQSRAITWDMNLMPPGFVIAFILPLVLTLVAAGRGRLNRR